MYKTKNEMAERKVKEMKIAYEMYVKEQQPAVYIAEKLNLSRHTVGDWVKKYNWRAERDARILSKNNQETNIRETLAMMASQRIDYARQLQAEEAKKQPDGEKVLQLRKAISSIDDGAAKWNKSLERMDKESRIPLSLYIRVCESIFEDLRREKPDLYQKTLTFQRNHLQKMAGIL